jgi:multidrug efflux pump subunit AcrB
MNQNVTFRSQSDGQIKQIPISSIAEVKYEPAFGSINRKDLERIVTISSNVVDGYNATEIVNSIKNELADYSMPEGYKLKFAGEQEEQQKQMEFLSFALLFALFLILLIIVAQFNKISAPFIILISVLFSTIGVFLGLMIFSMDFVVMMTMIGIISLAGVVVNNAIVLLDYANLTKDRRIMELGGGNIMLSTQDLINSIVKAGKTRLRPVLLTAITTVLGLLPLATGLNIDFYSFFRTWNPKISIGSENTIFWGPMSWTIVFGITFATFLTLVVVPVMILGVERFRRNVKKISGNAPPVVESAEENGQAETKSKKKSDLEYV